MSEDPAQKDGVDTSAAAPQRTDLPPAARRALAEAEERRRNEKPASVPRELGGRGGLEPTRYGDWEKDGIAHDF